MDSVVWMLVLCCVVSGVNSLPTPENLSTDIVKKCNESCVDVNKLLCYAPVTGECDKFIQCKVDAHNNWEGTIMSCAYGLFFHKLERLCLRPETVICETDKCRLDKQLSVYKAENGNCRSYWSCEQGGLVGRYSAPQCCPENSTFVNGECDSTVHCDSGCFGRNENETVCKLRAVVGKGKENNFIHVDEPGTEQVCAGGLEFDAKSCGCIYKKKPSNNQVTPACKADVDVEYVESGLKRKNMNWVGGNVPSVKTLIDDIEFYGTFNGEHYLSIPLYHGVNLKTLAGRMVFYPLPNKKDKQILFTNCIPRSSKGTFNIELDSVNNMLSIKGEDLNPKPFNLQMKYAVSKWNTLDFVFKGSTLKAQIVVDSKILASGETSNIQGEIRGQGPLRIGSCNKDGFYGYINKVQTYQCDPTTLFESPAAPAAL